MCWIWEVGCSGDQYAAWVQAVGSILALMVAISIAFYQSYKEAVWRERDEKEKHLRQLKSIFYLAGAMHQLLGDLSGKNPEVMQYNKPAYTESVGDLLAEIRRHPSDELNDEQRTSYFKLRRCFSEIFGHVHFGDELVFVDYHLKEVGELVETFRSYLELKCSS